MSVIGKFQSINGEIVGEIFTLSVQVQNVRIVREPDSSSEDAPTHRVLVGKAEIGAAWSRTSKEKRSYLSVKLDDPSFAQPIFCNLFQDDGVYTLVWSRSKS